MAKRGKKYRAAAEKIEEGRLYSPPAATRLVKETVTTKFDATVELVTRLGIDPRKADQMVRGSVALPHGTGKTARVAVFAEGPKANEGRDAGADVVGVEEITAMIEAGNLEFDAIIATPDQMGKIGRYGKVLGPRGLMPNPKTGTVTMDVGKAVQEIKAGKIEYRSDRQSNVHVVIGRASFSAEQLLDNYMAVVDELIRQRPAASKGRYLRSVHLSTVMGPSIPIDHAKKESDDDEQAGVVAQTA